MRRLLSICLLAIAVCGCKQKNIIGVSFPEAPVEIATNESFGMGLINMYNIIQAPDGKYRMYFIANPKEGIAENERDQNLYLAESEDGFNYEVKRKLMDALVEQTVFMVNDKEYPYRMVASQWVGEKSSQRDLFLWKSKDGIEFTDRQVLLEGMHDTQNVIIPRGNRMKLYSRAYEEGWKNRKMTLSEFDMDGVQTAETVFLPGDFLYNSAACQVDDRYDLLFPTYYNTYGGASDACFFKCFLADGPFLRQLPCELNEWVTEDEEWVLASPGFVEINGDRYLAYNSRTRSHQQSETGMVSRFKLIKVAINYE